MTDDGLLIDTDRTACLCDAGQTDYIATTAIDVDGCERMVLAHQPSIGDTSVVFGPKCPDVAHEQLGPLPLAVVRRITIASRVHRCGRTTKSGTPCRNTVAEPGKHCTWHRSERNTNA